MYLTYFSLIVKTIGVPKLNTDQFIRYQNIVAVEFYLTKLKKMKVTHESLKEIAIHENKLELLTKKLTPEDLLKEMLNLSLD